MTTINSFRHCFLLLLLLFTLLSLHTNAQTSNTSTPTATTVTTSTVFINGSNYIPDWSLVSTSPAAFAIASNVDIGTCICDLTFDVCDADCYCDANCTSTEKGRFNTKLQEGPHNYTVFKCTDPDLVTVNSRGAVTVTVINDLLCIAVNNNPTTGDFFHPYTTITSGEIDTKVSQLPYKYKVVDTVNLDSASTSDGFYKVDDSIGAAHVDVTGAVLPSLAYLYQGGYMNLPYPDGSENCNDDNYVKYLRPSSSVCTRRGASLQSMCTSYGPLSGSRYVNTVRVAKSPGASPSTVTAYLTPSLNYFYVSSVDGSVKTFVNGSVPNSVFPEPFFNSTSCTCENVLFSVSYTLTNELSGSVSAANVQAILSNIQGKLGQDGCGAVSWNQKYQVNWNTTGQLAVTRSKSGSPGYRTGYPVIAGSLATYQTTTQDANGGAAIPVTKKAIYQNINGLLALPTRQGGYCDLSGSRFQITYGQDRKFGCMLPLNLTNLQALCTASGVFQYLNLTNSDNLYVGKFGNADLFNMNEWTQMIPPDSTLAPTYNSVLRRCSGLTTGVRIEFVTADAGDKNNPQPFIMGAKMTYTTTTWQFTKPMASDVQRFPLYVVVTWVHLPPQGLSPYKPALPPVLPKFPNDLLYPLYIPSSANTFHPSVIITFLCVTIVYLFSRQ